jgi:hypothetical protein
VASEAVAKNKKSPDLRPRTKTPKNQMKTIFLPNILKGPELSLDDLLLFVLHHLNGCLKIGHTQN